MTVKNDLQKLNNQLDNFRHKLAAAQQCDDQAMVKKFSREIDTVTKQVDSLKGRQAQDLSGKGAVIKALAFHRVLTKAEQADMGKLKKSVKGLEVVHPLTKLGREMGISEVTGYSRKAF